MSSAADCASCAGIRGAVVINDCSSCTRGASPNQLPGSAICGRKFHPECNIAFNENLGPEKPCRCFFCFRAHFPSIRTQIKPTEHRNSPKFRLQKITCWAPAPLRLCSSGLRLRVDTGEGAAPGVFRTTARPAAAISRRWVDHHVIPLPLLLRSAIAHGHRRGSRPRCFSFHSASSRCHLAALG